MQQILQFGKRAIPYLLFESCTRKTLNIAVEDGQVLVTIPAGTVSEIYQPILHQKAPWIIKQLAHFEEMSTATRTLQFRSGEKLLYLGRYYRLKVRNEIVSAPIFRFSKGQFEAILPQHVPIEEYRDYLFPLYRDWIYHAKRKTIC